MDKSTKTISVDNENKSFEKLNESIVSKKREYAVRLMPKLLKVFHLHITCNQYTSKINKKISFEIQQILREDNSLLSKGRLLQKRSQ